MLLFKALQTMQEWYRPSHSPPALLYLLFTYASLSRQTIEPIFQEAPTIGDASFLTATLAFI